MVRHLIISCLRIVGAPTIANRVMIMRRTENLETNERPSDQPSDTPRASIGRLVAKPIRALLVVVLLMILTGAGLAGWRYVESYQSTDDAEIDGHIHAISSRIQASVARVWVEDNQHVKKGPTAG